MDADDPLYVPEGGLLVPTAHTRGPWDPRHQHGGAVFALVARAAEREAGDGFAITRLSLELTRPAPLSPLLVTSETTKPGRRTRGVAVTVVDDEAGAVVGVARAVAIAQVDLDLGEATPVPRHLSPGPEDGRTMGFGFVADGPAFHLTGMDVRSVDGGFDTPGPAKVWFRLRRPVVGDEEPTGLQRAAAAADFGNGISWELPYERWVYVNADVTAYLARPPEGEWIGLDARTLLGHRGAALAESNVYDRRGLLGHAAQSVVLTRREGP
jgi:hypothetical protein